MSPNKLFKNFHGLLENLPVVVCTYKLCDQQVVGGEDGGVGVEVVFLGTPKS